MNTTNIINTRGLGREINNPTQPPIAKGGNKDKSVDKNNTDGKRYTNSKLFKKEKSSYSQFIDYLTSVSEQTVYIICNEVGYKLVLEESFTFNSVLKMIGTTHYIDKQLLCDVSINKVNIICRNIQRLDVLTSVIWCRDLDEWADMVRRCLSKHNVAEVTTGVTSLAGLASLKAIESYNIFGKEMTVALKSIIKGESFFSLRSSITGEWLVCPNRPFKYLKDGFKWNDNICFFSSPVPRELIKCRHFSQRRDLRIRLDEFGFSEWNNMDSVSWLSKEAGSLLARHVNYVKYITDIDIRLVADRLTEFIDHHVICKTNQMKTLMANYNAKIISRAKVLISYAMWWLDDSNSMIAVLQILYQIESWRNYCNIKECGACYMIKELMVTFVRESLTVLNRVSRMPYNIFAGYKAAERMIKFQEDINCIVRCFTYPEAKRYESDSLFYRYYFDTDIMITVPIKDFKDPARVMMHINSEDYIGSTWSLQFTHLIYLRDKYAGKFIKTTHGEFAINQVLEVYFAAAIIMDAKIYFNEFFETAFLNVLFPHHNELYTAFLIGYKKYIEETKDIFVEAFRETKYILKEFPIVAAAMLGVQMYNIHGIIEERNRDNLESIKKCLEPFVTSLKIISNVTFCIAGVTPITRMLNIVTNMHDNHVEEVFRQCSLIDYREDSDDDYGDDDEAYAQRMEAIGIDDDDDFWLEALEKWNNDFLALGQEEEKIEESIEESDDSYDPGDKT